MTKRLPWLTAAQRSELDKNLGNIVTQKLHDRHWGAYSNHKREDSIILCADYRGLMTVIGGLRYKLQKMDTNILYRGQVEDYELIPSVYRGCKTKSDFEENEAWLQQVLQIAKPHFDISGTDDEREALLQHYECPTR